MPLIEGVVGAAGGAGAGGGGDGGGSTSDAPAGLYVPDLATWPDTVLTMPTAERYLQLAEALIAGDAPAVGTDAANSWALRVAGAQGGQQDISLAQDGQRRFAWSGSQAQPVAGWVGYGGAGQASAAWAWRVALSGDVTVNALGVGVGDSEAYATDVANMRRRVFILNADRSAVIAQSDIYTGNPYSDASQVLGVPSMATHYLTTSVDLAQGVDYWLAIVSDRQYGIRVRVNDWTDAEAFYGPADQPGTGQTLEQQPGTELDDMSGAVIMADSTRLRPREPVNDFRDGLQSFVGGSPGGVLIGGDMTLSAVQTGTPPNTPNQINVRLTWANRK